MKRTLSFLLALVMMCSLLSIGASAANDSATIQITGTLNYSRAEEVFQMLNEYRRQNGLKALVLDQKITEAAMLRAVESYVYTQHTRPNGYPFYSVMPYGSSKTAENQAWDYSSASSVMTAWKNSAGHNANMLLSNVTHVGIGCAVVNGRVFWIQLFSPKGADNTNDYASVDSTTFRYNIEVLPEYLKTTSGSRDIHLTPDSSATYIAEYTYANVSKALVPTNFEPAFLTTGYDLCFVYDNSGRAIATMKLYSGTMNQITITPMQSSGTGTVKLYAYSGDPNPIVLNITIGIHEHSLGTPFVMKNATCTQEGTIVRYCNGAGECDYPDRYYTEIIPKLEHQIPDTPSGYREANCYNTGYTGDYICKVCRTVVIEGEFTSTYHENISDWIIDERNSTDTRILRYKKCLDCNSYTASEWIDVEVSPSPVLPTPGPTEPTPTPPSPPSQKLTFTDVTEDAYYYNSVAWAVENGVTEGKNATSFAPSDTCTRAQVVTFLWRAAGSPKVSGKNPFEDVPEDAYYYDAVLWAVDRGITEGKNPTHFAPNDSCTRGHVVTFLYRYADSPIIYGYSPFLDVDYGAFYFSPVLWAVKYGITEGKNPFFFAPGEACTRAQVVTFLYRYMTN